MTWTDDRIDTLKRCWKDGLSASQIAQRLGGVTRNAVIGKVHRIGLAGRGNSSRKGTPTRPRASLPTFRTTARSHPQRSARRVPHSRAPAKTQQPPRLPELGPAPPSPVTVQSLTALVCRWPEGDPKTSAFHFCGRAKADPAIPYCDHHTAIAFR